MKLKYFFVILLTGFGFFNAHALHKKISVLFIGNSYTSVNDLPGIFDSIATANGDTVLADQYAPGGYTLQMHAADPVTLAKIHQRAWDYVVLQEQSQLPSLDPANVNTTTVPYALLLDSIIHANNSCTKTVFYLTWGRKYGDQSNCPVYPAVCTYSGMQQRLKESYKLMADSCHGIIAPVGEAFRRSMSVSSTIDLYQSDSSHPSIAGTYLAACVFYEVMLHQNPGSNPYMAGLPSATGYFLQSCARGIVTDSLNVWNLGIYEPRADFRWSEIASGIVQFTGYSNSSFSHYWNFGDTTFSTLPNPMHPYMHSRYWPVYHIVYDSCAVDSFHLTTNVIGAAGIAEISSIDLLVFPNPTSDFIRLVFPSTWKNESVYVVIENIAGCVLSEAKIENQDSPVLSIKDFNRGIYFIRVTNGRGSSFFSKKIIVMN